MATGGSAANGRQTARGVAAELLLRAEAAGQYADRALDAALSRTALHERDKALVTTLFYGVIERIKLWIYSTTAEHYNARKCSKNFQN